MFDHACGPNLEFKHNCAMRISLITPEPPSTWTGNRVTADRWTRVLQSLGHDVREDHGLPTGSYDLMIALHARKSAPAIERSANEHPGKPIIVALTGTDLYGDLQTVPAVLASLERATRIVTLQADAAKELPPHLYPRVRVIHQSVTAPASPPAKRNNVFDICVIGNLRDVKDPFLIVKAVRRLPTESRIRVVHIGAALDEGLGRCARQETASNPRYEWVGPHPREAAMMTLAGCRLMALTSKMEGGANVISESIVCGVPIVSSHISGSIGLLGEDYPGYFPVGDAAALATLLDRTEKDRAFLDDLTSRGTALAPLFSPAREEESWKRLLDEL